MIFNELNNNKLNDCASTLLYTHICDNQNIHFTIIIQRNHGRIFGQIWGEGLAIFTHIQNIHYLNFNLLHIFLLAAASNMYR